MHAFTSSLPLLILACMLTCSLSLGTGSARLCIGLVSAPRQPPELPVMIAGRIAANVDPSRTELFAQQAFASSTNTNQKAEFEKLGFKVFVMSQDYAQLAPGAYVPQTWGHTRDRVVWRTRELLDYVNTLDTLHTHCTADNVLVIEDDSFAAKDFGTRLLTAIDESTLDWSYIPLYSREFHNDPSTALDSLSPRDGWYLYCGSLAVVFKRDSIPGFTQYVRHDIFKDPIDWAIFTYFDGLGKKPALYVPSLFQHVGDISTFTQNTNRATLRSRTFVSHVSVLLKDYNYDAAGYIGCYEMPIDGYHFIKGSSSEVTGMKCASDCRAFRFYLLQAKQERCLCTNELIGEVETSSSNCHNHDGSYFGSNSATMAIYTTGLAFREVAGKVYFDTKTTVENRHRIEEEFMFQSQLDRYFASKMSTIDHWTALPFARMEPNPW